MATIKKPVFKENQKVSHAKHGVGRVYRIRVLSNGTWITVKYGDKKTLKLKSVRPSTLTKA